MLYTEKEKNEIERVRKVFEKHIQQMTGYDLVCHVYDAGHAALLHAGDV